MKDDPALKEIARILKEISSSLKDQNRILKAMNLNYLSVNQQSGSVSDPPLPPEEPVVVPPLEDPPKTYGWSMAASVQREDGLNAGDIKIEKDESRWVWTGGLWERIELPSGEK